MKSKVSVLRNLNLIDMSGRGDRIKKNRTVIIENGIIKSVFDSADTSTIKDPGHTVLDLEGKYLIPGLIDLHVHSTNPFIEPHDAVKFSHMFSVMSQVKKNMYNCIRGGVTTVRDMGSPPGLVHFMKMIEQGRMTGPRIVPSFSMISCSGGYPDMVPPFNRMMSMILGGQFAERIKSEEHAVKTVNTLCDKGAVWIKTVYQEKSYLSGNRNLSVPSDEIYEAIVRTARTRKKKIALHALTLPGLRKGLELNVNTIEHLPLEELSSDDINRIIENKTTMIPTLIAPGLYRENCILKLREKLSKDDGYLVPAAQKHTMDTIEQIIAGRPSDALIDYTLLRRTFSTMINNLRILNEAGAAIGFGTDAGGTDLCLFGLPHLEMQLMLEAGFANYEILQIATRKNAAVLDLDDRIGSIEPGRIADMVLLDGNPVEDLNNVSRVNMVWRNGVTVFQI